ncbi:E3 ubiquitin-protein ligase UPL7 isoform X2 [Impatiens glandulifera]|nr:E3 ubiquitin-protein ligase UPL7 isoform X2 [Impatiens glandulifera]XP_047316551.1 E3 ubiquitin-protein ligase UPL7 isoform X2 [Impatiens glandulifera]
MRLSVVLTDLKAWRCINDDNHLDGKMEVEDLIHFMGSEEGRLYMNVNQYIYKLHAPFSAQLNVPRQTDERLVITASAITLALRPLHIAKLTDSGSLDMLYSVEQFCVFILTIPWLAHRLPPVLLPALCHKTVLSLCFKMLLIYKEKILNKISEKDQLYTVSCLSMMPKVGWLLANIICLATGSNNNSEVPGKLIRGIDLTSYVHVIINLSENLLVWFEKARSIKKDSDGVEVYTELFEEFSTTLLCGTQTLSSVKMSYIDFFSPVYQQCHLMELLSLENDSSSDEPHNLLPTNSECQGKRGLIDVAYYYSCMLRIFLLLNPVAGPMSVLNMLSFTPGFLITLWQTVESSIFSGRSRLTKDSSHTGDTLSEKKNGNVSKHKRVVKDEGRKWASVLHKITGKSQANIESADIQPRSKQVDDDSYGIWNIESLKHGAEGMSKDAFCLLHLFCSTYSHLLVVLDDIEFYEKQVPFKLEQQQGIASMLNTFVYNTLSHSFSLQTRPLVDAAIRCLHLLYERDCRHQFCPPALWLAPAMKTRPTIAVAARTHEALSANLRLEDASTLPNMSSAVIYIPHIFPFEERVQMFREFINMDKTSRRMAGEVVSSGSRAVEVVIRRSHVIEDGFQQLNSLGSRLKSNIHVSFVGESGLQEAGLDYGGLSKEFLTDIAKAAFSPEYGLFCQTSTSDRLIIPNTTARHIDNGIQMIEFLGRIVGKALYEGILLDYSFSLVFVQKLLGRYSFLDELSTLDSELYKNIMYVKHYNGDVRELCLDFTVTEESLGKRQVIDLKPGGKDICVTNENKLQYIHAMADYKLNRQILPLSNAFLRGLMDLISPSWLKLFNASEFNQLLSGGKHDIDVVDLRNNTRYTGGYTEGNRTIKIFWEVLAGFEAKDRCMLLKFVTSCSRAPLLGFKYLQPAFTIHKVVCDMPIWATVAGQDVERLPSASTCYNTLKLPTYKRSNTLRAKLLYAINSNAGFELS